MVLSTLVQASSSNENEIQVIKRIYSTHGLSGFFRGWGVSITILPVAFFIKNPYSLQSYLLFSANRYLRNIIILSPPGSTINILKQLCSRSNLFNVLDLFISFMVLEYLSDNAIDFILLNGASIFQSILTTALIKCPIYCIQTQMCKFIADQLPTSSSSSSNTPPPQTNDSFIAVKDYFNINGLRSLYRGFKSVYTKYLIRRIEIESLLWLLDI